MKVRKIPVEVEAFRWTGGIDQKEDPAWMIDALSKPFANPGAARIRSHGHEIWMEIRTLESNMIASVGDYIIRGVEGEIYPCKPGIFQKTYEIIE